MIVDRLVGTAEEGRGGKLGVIWACTTCGSWSQGYGDGLGGGVEVSSRADLGQA